MLESDHTAEIEVVATDSVDTRHINCDTDAGSPKPTQLEDITQPTQAVAPPSIPPSLRLPKYSSRQRSSDINVDVGSTPAQTTSSQGSSSNALYSQPGPPTLISTDPVFPNYSTRQRSSNIRVENPDVDFLQTALNTCRSTILQQETEIKRLNESLTIRNKRIMQLESQVGSAAETLASRDIGSNTPENLVDKVDLLISKFEKFGAPTNNIYVNQYDPQQKHSSKGIATQTNMMFNCHKCSDNETNKNNVEYHQLQEHVSDACDNFQDHDQHQDEEHACILCKEVFSCQDDLRHHCELKHESDTYFCRFCGDIFTSNKNLSIHIEAQHTPRETHQTL